MSITTKPAIAMRLRLLADEMERLGTDIDYYGGLAEWSQHGREMVGAAKIARQWAEAIEANP
jgi:hypothetical protein